MSKSVNLFQRVTLSSALFLTVMLCACQPDQGSLSQQVGGEQVSPAQGDQSALGQGIQPLRSSSTQNGFVLELVGKSKCAGASTRELYNWKKEQKKIALAEITKACDEANKKAKDESKGDSALICAGMCPKNLNIQISQQKIAPNVSGELEGKVNGEVKNGSTANSSMTETQNSTGSSVSQITSNETKNCTLNAETSQLDCTPSGTLNNSVTDNSGSTGNLEKKRDSNETNSANASFEVRAKLAFNFPLGTNTTTNKSLECLSVDSTLSFASELVDLMLVCE